MRTLFQLTALFFSLLLVGMGVVLLFYPPLLQAYTHSFGLLLLSVGMFLLLAFYFLSRPRYLRVEMGGRHLLKISPAVIEQLVEKKLQVPCEVRIRGSKKIEISAHFPYLCEKTLEKIEKELTALLAHHCGYEKEFIFNLSCNNLQQLLSDEEQQDYS